MNTDRDAESVSRDPLQGDVMKLPGNALPTLNMIVSIIIVSTSTRVFIFIDVLIMGIIIASKLIMVIFIIDVLNMAHIKSSFCPL